MIKLMVNGLPGKMATKVIEHINARSDVTLSPFSFTGPEVNIDHVSIKEMRYSLVPPTERGKCIVLIKEYLGQFLVVDFTRPSAVKSNAEFYCQHELPFVMGTTGGDREALEQTVKNSNIVAVIAPNMAKQIVTFQAMMEYAATAFSGAFKDYALEIVETHQQGKADTSGTAKAMVKHFNKLGIPFSPEQIIMVRNPDEQRIMGVPEEHLGGHGWHTYGLRSPDGTVFFQFTHNINGRDVYAAGTLDALRFLQQKVDAGEKGKVYSMIDVLKGV